MGVKRPRFGNLDKYYNSEGGGDVVVDANTPDAMGCEEAYARREVLLEWLRNDGFPCDSHALRWVRPKMGNRGEIYLR